MSARKNCFGVLFTLACFAIAAAVAQGQPSAASPGNGSSDPGGSGVVPLTVQAGIPLDVALEKAVPIKHVGVPVEGHVVEPIYVFDHLVIPAGSQVLGHVTQVDNAPRKQRALAIANGNFTPLRTARVDFDTLVLKDGTRLPLQTVVTQGAPRVVHLEAGAHEKKKKGRVGQAVTQARQEVKSREQEAVQEIKAPGKMDRLKAVLAAELPYHKQTFPAGTHFTAELKTPLELGREIPTPKELEQIGGEIPPGSNVHVRLLTPLSSATDHQGSLVKAVVSEPVFSADHHVILPEGTRLEGTVTQAVPARRMGRNGQLRFIFHEIEWSGAAPPAAPRKVEASLQGVEAASADHLEVDAEGGAHAVTPKTKYIAPAIQVLLAVSALDGLDPHNRDRIEDGLGPQGPDVAGGAVRGTAGFALVGTVVGLLAHYRPISAGFAFYGAGWSVYTHVAARGTNVVFPKNTPMEIRFGTHESSSSAPAGKSSPSRL